MNEWQTIAWFTGIGGAFLGITWKMIGVAKDDLASRIKKCEHVIDNVVSDCSKKKDDYITTKGFDRFETHLSHRVDAINKSVEHLTARFDDFILAYREKR